MAEKEAAQAVQIENMSGSGDAGYDAAEMEPRMNTQTILAFIVRLIPRRDSSGKKVVGSGADDSSRLWLRSTMPMYSRSLSRRQR